MINDNVVKITGSASLIEGLEIDKSYLVSLDVECYSKERKSKQDGSYDDHYKLRLLTAEVLKDNGQVIKESKKQKTWSQKLRYAVEQRGHDYDFYMLKLLANLDKIDELIYD